MLSSILGLGLRWLRKNMTDAERKMWQNLRNRQVGGYKFRRQKPIGPYIVDFVCLEKKIIIEVDGGQHASNIDSDTLREDYLKKDNMNWLKHISVRLEEERLILDTLPVDLHEVKPEGEEI